jgi:hypothetical protein
MLDQKKLTNRAIPGAIFHDEYAGMGGSFEVRNGKRVPVEQTREAEPEKPKEKDVSDAE